MSDDRKKRQDGIHTMDDLIGRCKRDDMTGCMVWAGPAHKGSGAVWLPALNQSRSVTAAYSLLRGTKLPAGKKWFATCGNVLCIEHRRIGTASDAMRAVRPALSPEHRARITAGKRRSGGKYSPQLAAEIRASSDPIAVAAVRFGVHESTISKVRLGQMWVDAAPNSSVFAWRPAA